MAIWLDLTVIYYGKCYTSIIGLAKKKQLLKVLNSYRLENGKYSKDWHSFFKNISGDAPRQEIIDFVNSKVKTHNIIFVSGRPDTYRAETERWLASNRLIYQTLIMRKGTDSREDDIVKQEILDTYWPGDTKKNIELVIDDRPRVISMWRKNGLQVMDVGLGIDF